MRTACVFVLLFGSLAGIAAADVITSAPGGGPWNAGSSWIGGIVPGSSDDVIIASAIQVSGTVQCNTLTVNPDGTLTGAAAFPTVIAGGAVDNRGVIEDNTFTFDVRVGGDLTSTGAWTSKQTTLIGQGDVHLVTSPAAVLSTKLVRSAGATGDVLVDTPVRIAGGVDLGGGRMVLGAGSGLTIQSGIFENGELRCDGNTLTFGAGHLFNCRVDQAVLAGNAQTGHAVVLTGGVTVLDRLTNAPSLGSSNLVIEGGLVNQGTIENDTYGLTIELGGDLTIDGVLRNSFVALDGEGEHRLRMGPAGVIDTSIFLPEFQGGTIIAETDLFLRYGGISLGGGTMILEGDSSIVLTERGSLGGGVLETSGNVIHMDSRGALGDLEMNDVILSGHVNIAGTIGVAGSLKILGTLQNREFNPTTMRVDGRLINEGLIRDHGAPLTIVARGDLVNRGAIACSQTVMDGSSDQSITTFSLISVPDFVLDSNLDAPTLQWFKNGKPIAGQTGPTLHFAGVRRRDVGTYHCEAEGGEVSRAFVIDRLTVRELKRPEQNRRPQ